MALDIRIQQAAKEFRETVTGYGEVQLRQLAEDSGIDGFETTPLVTLREEIVQQWRDDARAAAYPSPQLMVGPVDAEEGNPGSDYVELIEEYA